MREVVRPVDGPAAGDIVHTFHWRFAGEREANPAPALDRFRYRARTWCDYRIPGSPYPTAERCNFNMYSSALQI